MIKKHTGSISLGRENKVLVLESNLLILDKSKKVLEHSFEVCSKIGVKPDYIISELDAFEAFSSRFARSADLITQKVLPSVYSILQENPKTFIDRINLAEKLGLIEDIDKLKDIREIRNVIAHEYSLNDISEYFSDVIESTKILLEIIEVLVIKIKEKIN